MENTREGTLAAMARLREYRLPDDMLEWRVSREVGTPGSRFHGVVVLCYLTSRAVQDTFDDFFGQSGWQLHQEPIAVGGDDGFRASILVRLPDGEGLGVSWIRKDGIGACSDIEPLKGGASDAEKRAAVEWGLGRYLYRLPVTMVQLSANKIADGIYHKGKDGKAYYWLAPRLGGGEAPQTTRPPPGPAAEDPQPPPETPARAPEPNHAPSNGRRPAWEPRDGYFAGIQIGVKCYMSGCNNPWPCDDHPVCMCGGQMWDNRKSKTNQRSPDFKCKNAKCADGEYGSPKGIYWTNQWQKNAQDCRSQNGLPVVQGAVQMPAPEETPLPF